MTVGGVSPMRKVVSSIPSALYFSDVVFKWYMMLFMKFYFNSVLMYYSQKMQAKGLELLLPIITVSINIDLFFIYHCILFFSLFVINFCVYILVKFSILLLY